MVPLITRRRSRLKRWHDTCCQAAASLILVFILIHHGSVLGLFARWLRAASAARLVRRARCRGTALLALPKQVVIIQLELVLQVVILAAAGAAGPTSAAGRLVRELGIHGLEGRESAETGPCHGAGRAKARASR